MHNTFQPDLKNLFHWADKVQFAPLLLPKMIKKKIVIQSNQVKHTPKILLMNILFQKLNPLVLPQTISNSNLENEGNPSCIMSC